ncbi:hypothetical protein B0H19DRAFT_1082764 [Mycena capillaripes]|nr:hypothetical protein B0H19DRAFT_1082764 [Mycena capillaripes]
MYRRRRHTLLHGERRTIQNYLHAVLGLILISLGIYHIHSGYAQEWPNTGLGKMPDGLDVVFLLWCIMPSAANGVILVIAYAVRMRLIEKQYKQEAAATLDSTTVSVWGDKHIGLAALERQRL